MLYSACPAIIFVMCGKVCSFSFSADKSRLVKSGREYISAHEGLLSSMFTMTVCALTHTHILLLYEICWLNLPGFSQFLISIKRYTGKSFGFLTLTRTLSPCTVEGSGQHKSTHLKRLHQTLVVLSSYPHFGLAPQQHFSLGRDLNGMPTEGAHIADGPS